MNYENKNQGIRLSVLNPQVRERVEKFDTGNDGELDINEAMQGLIALQKQSNNYKKMIWLLIPVLSLMIAATFGTTLLAINLTKDVKSSTIEGNIPVLKTINGESISVYNTMEHTHFSEFQEKQTSELNLLPQFIQIDSLKMKASGMFQTQNTTYTLTDFGTFISDVNTGLTFEPFTHLLNNKIVQDITNYVNIVKAIEVEARVNATIEMYNSLSKDDLIRLDSELEELSIKLKTEHMSKLTDDELLKKVSDLQSQIAIVEKPCRDKFYSCQKKLFSSFIKCRNELNTCLSNTQLYVSYSTQLNDIWGLYKNFCVANYSPGYQDCHVGFCNNQATCVKCVNDFREYYNDIFRGNCPETGP
uniref:EF-hand domain-containing protein n=1 Tax=viral metagenome TaxID=1070528 RepID=A0A6C0HDG9_9ZZZZ